MGVGGHQKAATLKEDFTGQSQYTQKDHPESITILRNGKK
jgi:hypothetical protein